MKHNRGRAALWVAAVVFLIFLSNVALGGARMGTFLDDVGEAVVLFVSVVFFVVGILRAEQAAAHTTESADGR